VDRGGQSAEPEFDAPWEDDPVGWTRPPLAIGNRLDTD